MSTTEPSNVTEATGYALGLTATSALTACEKQKEFVQALNRHDTEADEATTSRTSNRKHQVYDHALTVAVGKTTKTYMRSLTAVMESAFFLLPAGLWNARATRGINVKQAPTILWNAAWQQGHTNKVWAVDHLRRCGEDCRSLHAPC